MRIRSLMLILIVAWPSSSGYSQEGVELNSAELRIRVYELLSYQCGADDIEDRFRLEISKLGQEVQPLLVSVMRDGLPEEIRRDAQVQAERRYARRQAWLKENGEELFGDETERLSAQTSESYIADALRQVDILFRENAVRGLGVIGNTEAARAIEASLEQDPSLSGLAESALQEIGQRN